MSEPRARVESRGLVRKGFLAKVLPEPSFLGEVREVGLNKSPSRETA